MIRVLIADDHAIVRQGLKQILAETDDMLVCAETGEPSEILPLLEHGGVNVVVLDLSMPGRGGMDVLKQIRADHSSLPVLILSMHPTEQYAVRVMRAGASGYLNKDAASAELVNAIRQISSGRKYVTPDVAEQLAQALLEGHAGAPHEALSDREYQVMLKIASGKTVGEIAEAMSLSVKTVSTYRARVLEKMSMSTNAELTRYVITNQLMD